MKKIITFIILLCAFIIAFAILNNNSFNEEMQSKKSIELSKDSLLYRQVELQGLLLGKYSVLDTMNLEHKSNNSIIKDVSTSIYVEVDSKVLLGLPFCDKAFVR